jgi:hypothetical protein
VNWGTGGAALPLELNESRSDIPGGSDEPPDVGAGCARCVRGVRGRESVCALSEYVWTRVCSRMKPA